MPVYLNSFHSPEYLEQVIVDSNGGKVGTIRIKPSGVLWKPRDEHKSYSINLEKFTEWITDPKTKARRTKS